MVGRRRSEFDRLVLSTAQALSTIDDGRGDPPVRATGRLPEGSVDALVAYLDFLDTGGRARSYFRTSVQRDVEPVLGLLRVGDHEPATADELRIVLTHFELGERLVAVDADCATLDLPTPQNPDELTALSQVLTDIGAAAALGRGTAPRRAVPASGLAVSVPDVASAEQFAAAVLDYDENGSPREAAQRLDALADDLAALAPAQATAPEHTRAVAALRARDPAVPPRRSTSSSVPTWPSATSGAPACCSPGSGPSRSPARGRTGVTVHRAGSGWSGSHRRSGCSPSCRHRTGRTSWWCSTPAASASTAR